MTLYTAKQFSVDSEGAYLVDLYDSTGWPILFPRTMIDGKRRGGSHVCLPYFGADATGALPQHGFGRDVEWQVSVVSDQVIECAYVHSAQDSFEGLEATLRYELAEAGNGFTTTLSVKNGGKKPMTITPGFHPYFAVDPADVRLDGEKVDLADFEPYKEYPGTSSMTIASGGRTITVSSDDLEHMVVWTNLQGDFLCVEPTLSGHSFDSTKLGDTILEPETHVQYGYAVKWS